MVLSNYRMGQADRTIPFEVAIQSLYASGYFLDNIQTRMLSGLPEMLDPKSKCTKSIFDLALNNLLNVYALAAEDRSFDDFLAILLAALGAPAIVYFRRNVSRVSLREEFVREQVPEIQAHSSFDTALVHALEGKVRIRLEASPHSEPSKGCLAFGDVDGRKIFHDAENAERYVNYLEGEGIKVARHNFGSPLRLENVRP